MAATQPTSMRERAGLPAAILAVVLCSSFGCAARADQRVADDATALTSRVEAYWKRREAKDLLGAYAFYCSAYKKRVPQADFLSLTRLTRFDIRDTRVLPVGAIAERVEVTVSFRFLMPKLTTDTIESQTKEWWARDVDRQWCKEDEPLVLPFPRRPQPAPVP